MSDTPESEPSPFVRLPWPWVAGGLLVLLVALLAIGLYANRNLRPGAAAAPTPLLPLAATATPIPVSAAPTATLAPTSPIIGSLANSTPTAVPVTAQPSPTSVRALATQSPTSLPTVEPTLAAEVGQAYENFWHVRSQALLELNPSHLGDVMDGDYLTSVSQSIEELRAEGRAIKTQVVLSYAVLSATPDAASVVDDFEDNSVYVKIGTEDPLTEPTGGQLRVLYKLRKLSGVWKVVDSVRSE